MSNQPEDLVPPDVKQMDGAFEKASHIGLPEAVTLAEFLQKTFDDDIPVIKNLFDLGRKVMIVAKSKLGKTYFALSLALHLTIGKNLCQLELPNALNVLFVNYELHEHSLSKRIKKILNTYPDCEFDITKVSALNIRGFSCDTYQMIEHIIQQAKKHNSQVIILDPLYLLLNGNENDTTTILEVVRSMDRIIRETKAAFIYVHHDTKGNYPGERSNVDRGSGSGVLGRHWDAQIALSEHAESEKAVVLDFTSRDYESLPSITMERREGCLVCSTLSTEKRTKKSDSSNVTTTEEKANILQEAANYILEKSFDMDMRSSQVATFIKERFNSLSERKCKYFIRLLDGYSVPTGQFLKLHLRKNHHNYFTIENPK